MSLKWSRSKSRSVIGLPLRRQIARERTPIASNPRRFEISVSESKVEAAISLLFLDHGGQVGEEIEVDVGGLAGARDQPGKPFPACCRRAP